MEDVYFSDKKNNIIIDGYFTKIIYSNQLFSTNGLFFLFPVLLDRIELIMDKRIARFQPYSRQNVMLIQQMVQIESLLIDLYKTMQNCHKNPSFILAKQLYSGSLKLYREHVASMNSVENRLHVLSNPPEDLLHLPPPSSAIQYVIKITGIWETNFEVGITYKLQASKPV